MKNAWKVVLLPLILMTLFVLDVVKGSVEIPLSYILQLPFADPGPETEAWRDILLIFRLPRAVTALLVGAGLALDMGSWKAFDYAERDEDDPENENDPVYSDGDKTNVGFNVNGGVEFFVMDALALRPTTFFDFAGSVHWAIGLSLHYYF